MGDVFALEADVFMMYLGVMVISKTQVVFFLPQLTSLRDKSV